MFWLKQFAQALAWKATSMRHKSANTPDFWNSMVPPPPLLSSNAPLRKEETNGV
jgi:hypothetical protein